MTNACIIFKDARGVYCVVNGCVGVRCVLDGCVRLFVNQSDLIILSYDRLPSSSSRDPADSVN